MLRSERSRDVLALASLCAIAAAMAAWSWRTWPDVLIDFGREAYVAWRLAEGDVLHRDVVYVSGPLSPYWNALAFRLFGVGLDTLFALNGVLLAVLTFVWFRLLKRVADGTAAWAGCAVFLTLFGFGQYVGVGNYNYLAPYSHELPHGLLLASLGFAAWTRAAGRPAGLWDAAAGFALGCVALTKLEVFAPAAAASAVGLLVFARRESGKQLVRRAVAFGLGAGIPIAVATALLATPLGFIGALEALAIAALRLLGDDVTTMPFYQRGIGTDELSRNTGLALLWTAKVTALFVPAGVLAWVLRGERARRPWVPVACAAGMIVLIAPFSQAIAWLQAPRALPVFLLAGLGLGLYRGLGRPNAREDVGSLLLRALLATFATGMLAKIFFLARIHHYGFALAMPASLLFVAALVCWVADALSRRGANDGVFRGAALGVLSVAVVAHLQLMAPYLAMKSSRLGAGDDSLRVRPAYARMLAGALTEVRGRSEPDDAITVMPEGVMLNFLTRRPTATPHFSFNPFELRVYGESEMIRAFDKSPPAAVVLVHQDTSEHGAQYLGRDYGVDLLAWVRENYRTVRQIGAAPLEPGNQFGVEVLERKNPKR